MNDFTKYVLTIPIPRNTHQADLAQSDGVEKMREILLQNFSDPADQQFLENSFLKNGGLYLKLNMRDFDNCNLSIYNHECITSLPVFMHKMNALIDPMNLAPIWQEKEQQRDLLKQKKAARKVEIAEKLEKKNERQSEIASLIEKDPLCLGGLHQENVREILAPVALLPEEEQDPLADTAFKVFYKDLMEAFPAIPKSSLKYE